MSAPTIEERARARALYMQLMASTSPALPYVDEDTVFCVDVALRLARHIASTFGLPSFRGNVHHRHGETSLAWIDRLAAEIEAWRGAVEEPEKRRRRHRRDASPPLRRVRPLPSLLSMTKPETYDPFADPDESLVFEAGLPDSSEPTEEAQS